MFILVVNFEVKPEYRNAFKSAATADAQASKLNEPGCLRFDVYEDLEDPNKFVFVEVYEDEAAFKAHTTYPHFAKYREATQGMTSSPPTRVNCTNVWPPNDQLAN